jgi:hypothetical protein
MKYNITYTTGNGTTIAATNDNRIAALRQAAEMALDIARRFRPSIVVTMEHEIGTNRFHDALNLWNRVVEDEWSLPSVIVEPATEVWPLSSRSSA